MECGVLTEADLRQLATVGISRDDVFAQIDFLRKGTTPLTLSRPCTRGDGIVVMPEEDMINLVELHDEAAREGRCVQFVPASGAASRMFAHWHLALVNGASPDGEFEKNFADNLHRFAFFPELKEHLLSQGKDVEILLREGKFNQILQYILMPRGLNYGHLPKALLKFHSYGNESRTPLEEHLAEAAFLTTEAQGNCGIHFTVSEEHRKQVQSFLSEITPGYERRFGIKYLIGLSTQSKSSDTVAMDGKTLLRDRSGRLILRPGGHGALLANLNSIDGNIIFIKNIDNVVPDRLKSERIFYKKVLGGYYIRLEKEIFRHLRILSKRVTEDTIRKARLFCQRTLNVVFPTAFDDTPFADQCRCLIDRLNRPLRVCGMVKNEGEPGGGPFWVEERDGQSLQIVEHHQIDTGCPEQEAIWSSSTHFNPVDLVCGIRDYQSQKFDLSLFVEKTAVSLSKKIEKGKLITVLEHPGLWNGAMARWNTVFVEVPIATFNPVKTIDDLLRPQHNS